MSNYTYATILKKAKNVNKNVKEEYKLRESSIWSYYFAKAMLNPKKDIQKINIATAEKSSGDNFGRQIKKDDYINMAERLVKYVEKHNQLPNNISVYNMKMRVSDYTYLFSRCLAYYDNHKEFIDKANCNSTAFTKPTENKNTVFTKWVTTFKFTPKYIDDVCDYILKYFTYLFYYDDHKSNAEVISSKSGNCTDLLQMLINMAEALGYEWKVIHTQCKKSKVGHVYGMFRKAGVNNGNWFVRDIACIADESRYCVWCEVPSGGNKLAENPSWFLENLRR